MAVIEGRTGQGSEPTVRTKLRLINDTSLDGRTRSVRMVKEFERQLGLDLGGTDQLTEAQRALARRSAILNAILTDCDTLWCKDGTMDLSAYVTATNSLRRLLISLGLGRVQKRAGIVELMDV